MTTQLRFFLLTLFIISTTLGCKTASTESEDDTVPKFEVLAGETSISPTNPSNYAQQTRNLFTSFTTTMENWLHLPAENLNWQKTNVGWVYNFTENAQAYRYTIKNNAQSYEFYKLAVKADQIAPGPDSLILIKGEFSKNRTLSNWLIYTPTDGNAQRKFIEYRYQVDGTSHVTTIQCMSYALSDVNSVVSFYDAVINADKSGIMTVTESGVKTQEMQWAADGSGVHKTYVGGTVNETHYWSK